ncbi:malonate decarboxylase acyl carrier protein [Bradyrhizobium sp. USDA 4454]
METLSFRLSAPTRAGGTRMQAIVGVVASGNLEVLLERSSPADICTIDIATAAHGFGAVWDAVVRDFVARRPAGGLRISINDGGARPDTVALRLAQGVRKIEEPER